MSNDDASALVVEYIESVWNEGDVEALRRLTTEGFQYFLGGQPGRDRAGMEAFLSATRAAFSDWRVVVEAVVADAGRVAVRWTGTVTHDGPFHAVPASGARVAVSGINLYELEGGRIAREWEQMDSLGMLRQMGVTP